jgi:hypothetical protein
MVDKSQEIRLIDVFIISPFLIYYGLKAGRIPQTAKDIMVVLGILTGIYNGKNYLENRGVI